MAATASPDPTAPFRGWVRQRDRFAIERLRLEPIGPADVVVRNRAAQGCYTLAEFLPDGLHTDAAAGATLTPRGGHDFTDGRAKTPGHGAAGVVVAVGPQVRRVAVGDRVVTTVLPSCGTCYSCVRGEWAACGHKNDIQWADRDNPAFATLLDGTPVWQDHTGGFAEFSGSAPVSWGVAATRRGGTFVHTGWTAPTSDPAVWDPAPGPFDYHAKQYLSASYGGGNVLRDIPRLAKLIESGHLDARALCEPVLPFEQGDVALRHALDRDRILPVISYAEPGGEV